MTIDIAGRIVGKNHPIFFIAEAGVNHNGQIEIAKKLIDVAVDAKVDAVKFQTFKAEQLNIPSAPKAKYHIETTGKDESQTWFELLKSQEISYKMHEEIISYCNDNNILFLSTPYSKDSVDLLENFNLPAYKIASADLNNLPLLDYVSKKGKPIIISTGMATIAEIKTAQQVFIKNKLKDYIFLQCTSNYPTNLADSNLRVINSLSKELGCLTGYSDHTSEIINPIAATAIGATVYEKHFTLDKKMVGPDHRMSLSPEELKKTIEVIRNTELAMGHGQKQVLDSEKENRLILRKSIVTAKTIKKNEVIKEDMLGIKRPGSGIEPSRLYNIIGKVAARDLSKDYVVSFDDLI